MADSTQWNTNPFFLVFCVFTLMLGFTVFAHVVNLQAQELDPPLSDSLALGTNALPNDSLGQAILDSLSKLDQEKPIFRYPWPTYKSEGANLVLSDSLWRWNYYSDLSDRLMEIPGNLPYRSGIVGRNDATSIGLHDPRFQDLSWGLMPLDDPLSKVPLTEFIPINKVRTIQMRSNTGRNHLRFDNRMYQVNEPWTRLYFDESEADYQNLEFMITRNFGRKFNLEIGYRQQRDGNLYRNNQSESSQIFVQNSFYVTNNLRISHRFFTNDFSVDEPFGYQFNSPSTFSFNPFFSSPNFQGRQNTTFNINSVRFELRTDSVASAHTELEIFRKKYDRLLNSDTDTVNTETVSVGLALRKNIKPTFLTGSIELKSTLERISLKALYHPFSIGKQNWIDSETHLIWTIPLNSDFDFFSSAELGYTNPFDNTFVTYGFGIGVDYRNFIKSNNSLRFDLFQRTESPTVEELAYLQESFLSNALIERRGVQMELEMPLKKSLSLHLKSGFSQTNNILLMPFGYFNASANVFNSPFFEQNEGFGTVFLKWNPGTLYSNYTLTYQLREISGVQTDDRLFSRWVLGWQNYAFNKATYLDISAELRNEFLPFYGLARDQLRNRWQIQNTGLIPAYTSALDLRVSARLRSIMILVRWENLLDQGTQLGYFETIGYPTPYRRLLFSVRALFKN